MRLKIKWTRRKVDTIFDCHCSFISAGPEMLSTIIEQHANLAANEAKKGKMSKVLFYFCLVAGKESDSTQRELMFLISYISGEMEGRMKVGHQLKDFIKSCTFGGLECVVDNG